MLIDDEPAQCRLVTALAAREGWRVVVMEDGEAAVDRLAAPGQPAVSAILLDQWVPGDDACALVARLRELNAAIPILVLTASASPLPAVEAMRAGATDYLIKPVAPERLLQALRCATLREPARNELQPLSEKLSGMLDFEQMVGTAPAFRSALAQAAKAARGQGHVLILGESGTGKETVLRAMHAASPRSKSELRKLGLAAVPVNSVESLLFGHEQNAFPGAFERKAGLLQNCDGMTLLIDDIDRLELGIQDRLAEVLESRIVRPIGAAHGFRVDVRLFGASDQPLDELARSGAFSQRLYRQIASTCIRLPALRERRGDVPALVRHFLARIGEQPGLVRHSITDSAMSLLSAYDWPGNVRQLQAALFRAAVFCDGESLTVESFPQLREIVGDPARITDTHRQGVGVLLYGDDGHLRPLEEIEADVIRLAIVHYSGRMTEVARRLGIGRSTLYRKLSTLGIDNAA
jgi:DNA-binding NtrC family response regulator